MCAHVLERHLIAVFWLYEKVLVVSSFPIAWFVMCSGWVVSVSVSGTVGRRFKSQRWHFLTRNNLEKVIHSHLLRPAKPSILWGGWLKSFVRLQGIQMHHETYAACRRIWWAHTSERRLAQLFYLNVMPAYLSLMYSELWSWRCLT